MVASFRIGIVLAVIASALAVAGSASALVFTAAGGNPAAIQATVDAFRAALGSPNNANALGPVDGGRREINWDGAAAPFVMAPDLFNAVVRRGAVFATPGTGFRQSNPTGGPDDRFSSINATYPDQFQTFSAPRLFTAVGSNIVDAFFFVPGTPEPVVIRGFGAVFTDVDLANATRIQLYDENNVLIADEAVPVAAQGLSFLGITLDDDIFRVRLISGSTAVGPDDSPSNQLDVVVMDDFLYSEPRRIDAPAGALFLAAGLAFAARRTRLSRARVRRRAGWS
ncbi:MAG: hypothetical protein FJX67_07160 [Alphaproteobacteria bacterium]|nr:hypothetical protein [Alphaproteobacteria bacterium]